MLRMPDGTNCRDERSGVSIHPPLQSSSPSFIG